VVSTQSTTRSVNRFFFFFFFFNNAFELIALLWRTIMLLAKKLAGWV
jgi:hypothetical protein